MKVRLKQTIPMLSAYMLDQNLNIILIKHDKVGEVDKNEIKNQSFINVRFEGNIICPVSVETFKICFEECV